MHRFWWLALSLPLLSIAPLSSPLARADGPSTTTSARIAGDFRFIGGDRERQQMEDAIDRATADMNVFVRTVAREKLRSRTKIPSSLRIAVDDTRVSVTHSGHTVTAPRDGSPVSWTNAHGEDLTVLHHLTGHDLVQEFRGDGGGRHNRFRPSGDGGRLRMEVTISSPRLPEKVQFTLTYARMTK